MMLGGRRSFLGGGRKHGLNRGCLGGKRGKTAIFRKLSRRSLKYFFGGNERDE